MYFCSKLPHNVGIPCAQRSKEYSETNVVFPDPVGPVMIVSSPGRSPLRFSLSLRNRVHCLPFNAGSLRNLNNSSPVLFTCMMPDLSIEEDFDRVFSNIF